MRNVNEETLEELREISERGIGHLRRRAKEYTPGATYFLRQFSAGQGDYTAEREELLAGITLDEIIKNVREIDERNNKLVERG